MDFTQQGQSLFGGGQLQGNNSPLALMQLANILGNIQKRQQQPDNSQMQASQVQLPQAQAPELQTPEVQAPKLSSGSGMNLPAMTSQLGNLQYLPWLNPQQNVASMMGAMGQAGGSSALSSLADWLS